MKSKIFTEKISPLRLSSRQKESIRKIMTRPLAYVPDIRFQNKAVISKIMRLDFHIRPQTTINREQEQILFLQMNFARYRISKIREKMLHLRKWHKDLVLELLHWHQKQLTYQSQIVRANIGLVFSLARTSNFYASDMSDLISEGNMALLKAVNGFDCSRGYKFSTYAYQIITKSFYQVSKKAYRYHKLFPISWQPDMEKFDQTKRRSDDFHNHQISELHLIINENQARLTENEKKVLQMRFGLKQTENQPLTLSKIGQKLNLSKERIRQIQNQAINKIRETAKERLLAS
ncbi:MAG: sigma-70 family RNA polymerase sigma factor [Sedimentisphaerales bacterium]|nr:sigma-70 family RNA polymerase sigma factor [Sedimentisphaerales bacterium]